MKAKAAIHGRRARNDPVVVGIAGGAAVSNAPSSARRTAPMSGTRSRIDFFRQTRSVWRTWRGDRGRQRVPSGLSVDDVRQRLGDVVATERPPPGEHLEQHGTEGPDVRTLVHRPAARRLGRHVRGRAENHPGLRHRRCRDGRRLRHARRRARGRVHRLREPEVEDLHRAISTHLDVRGLQIAMDDRLLVRGFECLGDLLRDGQRVAHWNRALRNPLRQIVATADLV
jgi:hypothetical protein